MKALALYLTIFCCCIFAFVAKASDSLSGKVIDSVTGLPIPGVTVKIVAPVCSTQTDTDGKFEMTIYTTGVRELIPKITLNRTGWNFSGYGEEARFELIGLSGKAIIFSKGEDCAKHISSGVWFVRVKEKARVDVYKIVNTGSGSSPISVKRESGEIRSKSLAKTAVVSYDLSFQKEDYNSMSLSVFGSATDLVARLSPVVLPPETGSVCANVLVQKIGSLTNGPVTFGQMINPNKLIIRIRQYSTATDVVCDTVRDFVVGETFSKTYFNLLAGQYYQVSAHTVDSSNSNPDLGTNQYKIVDSLKVEVDEIDTANFNLQAACVHFGAKFAPCSSAVRVEAYVQTLTSNSGIFPFWIDSLIIPKGKKDESIITENVALSAASLAPFSTDFKVRLRVYGDSNVVLYEGIDTVVSVLPGADVPYFAEMKQMFVVPVGAIMVNTLVQKIGSLTNGPVTFGQMISPNKLIVRVRQLSSGKELVCDTVRDFIPGETFSKTYHDLPPGYYQVSAYTVDSSDSNPDVGTNQYKVIDSLKVEADKTDTADFSLQASCVHFGAKFAPCSSAVRVEAYVQTLTSNSGIFPFWIDSLIIPKGKKDESIITENVALSAASLAPFSTDFKVRLRVYGDSNVVLYEGIDTVVSVLPGADVPYFAEMKQMFVVPVGAIRVNVFVQKKGSLTNGPTEFAKVFPNWLIITLASVNGVTADTIRDFVAGETFSKTYSNLPSGFAYRVGAWTEDSVSGTGENDYRIIENRIVNIDLIDTVSLSLPATYFNFAAKFAPVDSAVEVEAYVPGTNGSYYMWPDSVWRCSKTFSKGNKDTLVVTKNLVLPNRPDISMFNIRLRVYGENKIVLYEGAISDVAVLPGVDQTYSVEMTTVE